MKQIPLSQGGFALVDDEDYSELSKYRWRDHYGYASRWVRLRSGRGAGCTTLKLMHRDILNPPDGVEVDHINGDRCDNRRANLRLCTKTENQRNSKKHKDGTTSKYKGVSKRKGSRLYKAEIRINGKQIYLGNFTDERDAARAYNEMALKHFGAFARLNEID